MSNPKDFFDFEKRCNLFDGADTTLVANTYVWGSTVIKIGSTYHAYIAAWDNVDGINGYAYYGKIYYGTSSNLTGPFTPLTELAELDGQTWCAGAKVNPKAIVVGDTIYLYFTGTTSETPTYPILGTPARNNQRIGVATTSTSTPEGPFTLYTSNPILSPVAASWDELFVNNPAPFVARNGMYFMIYKGCTIAAPSDLFLGVATSHSPLGPWTNAATAMNATEHEDPCVWREGEFFYMITKAMDNTITTAGNGILWYSKSGAAWTLVTDNSRAYRPTAPNTALQTSVRARVERPEVIVVDGKAVAFFVTLLSIDTLTSINLGRSIRP